MMTIATGTAMAMKIDLSALIKRHGMRPPRFTPLPLKPVTDGECSIQGFASPSSIDREHMKFASLCWRRPFGKEIPLLFRHQKDRVAGKLLDIEARYGGLFVRALVTDAEAKRCPYFSVAATIHQYELRQVDDPAAAHALITSARLDEVSLVPDNPGHPDAIVEPTPAVVEFFNLAIRGVGIIQRQLELLQQIAPAPPTPTPMSRPRSPIRRAPVISSPRRPTQFSALAAALNERTA
jgi:hypothetical protein